MMMVSDSETHRPMTNFTNKLVKASREGTINLLTEIAIFDNI